MARGGFSALERFGAELEAMFVGEPAPVQTPNVPEPVAESPAAAPRLSTIGAIEADLARQLMEDGVVVRGHDVARVVGLMAGVAVPWVIASVGESAPPEGEAA